MWVRSKISVYMLTKGISKKRKSGFPNQCKHSAKETKRLVRPSPKRKTGEFGPSTLNKRCTHRQVLTRHYRTKYPHLITLIRSHITTHIIINHTSTISSSSSSSDGLVSFSFWPSSPTSSSPPTPCPSSS